MYANVLVTQQNQKLSKPMDYGHGQSWLSTCLQKV